MTIDRAIDISSKFSMGCHATLKDGEIQEYNQLCFDALRAQQEAEKNDPLTLDELREMDGKPVWAVLEDEGMSAYAIVDSGCECVRCLNCFLIFEGYGVWIAYRRPPEKEA